MQICMRFRKNGATKKRTLPRSVHWFEERCYRHPATHKMEWGNH